MQLEIRIVYSRLYYFTFYPQTFVIISSSGYTYTSMMFLLLRCISAKNASLSLQTMMLCNLGLRPILDVNRRYIKLASSSVVLSTMEDGKIVKGLAGVPEEGPVLLVGYHMLMGLELAPLVEAFIREKNILVRGIAHPELFLGKTETSSSEFSFLDWVKVFGALPVSASNLFRLFETKSHVLLYPGGAREALHLKVSHVSLFDCAFVFQHRKSCLLSFVLL